MAKIDRATNLMHQESDSNCFPWELFHAGHFEETKIKETHARFKNRYPELQLGIVQYKNAVLGVAEKMEREFSPGTFDEQNYRPSAKKSIEKLLADAFKRLNQIIN